MPYTYSEAVRELTPLFKNIEGGLINRFIRRASSKIDRRLGGKYQIPITKRTGYFSTGTVSIVKDSNIISGSSTLFLTDSGNAGPLIEGDYLSIGGKAVVRIDEVLSETAARISHDATITVSSANFFVIPDALVTANEYLAAKLIIIKEFSNQAYNQETTDFSNKYGNIAREEIDGFLVGNYYDSSLQPQSSANSAARIVQVVSNDTRTMAENVITEMNDSLWSCS